MHFLKSYLSRQVAYRGHGVVGVLHIHTFTPAASSVELHFYIISHHVLFSGAAGGWAALLKQCCSFLPSRFLSDLLLMNFPIICAAPATGQVVTSDVGGLIAERAMHCDSTTNKQTNKQVSKYIQK